VFSTANGAIECRREAPWFSHFSSSHDVSDNIEALYAGVQAVPDKGFYFDTWELFDRKGRLVNKQYLDMTVRTDVLELTVRFVAEYNIAEVRAVFTNDETRLVDLKTPVVNIYGINGAAAAFNTLPNRTVAGTYLVLHIVPDNYSVLYQVAQLFSNPDSEHWYGGDALMSHMKWRNAHLGYAFRINDRGYSPTGSSFHNQPFPFTSFEITARLKEDVSIIRIVLRNQDGNTWITPSAETHIVPLGEAVAIAYISQTEISSYSIRLGRRVVGSTTGYGVHLFLRWEDRNRELLTEDYYFIIEAKYHEIIFYRINYWTQQ